MKIRLSLSRALFIFRSNILSNVNRFLERPKEFYYKYRYGRIMLPVRA